MIKHQKPNCVASNALLKCCIIWGIAFQLQDPLWLCHISSSIVGVVSHGSDSCSARDACGGADEVPELAEGEAALKEALPLAEALDEVALESW